MSIALLSRKQTHFILWRPGYSEPTPTLFIGTLSIANPTSFANFREIPLQQSPNFPEIWEVEAQNCDLTDGQVYFYWFKVRDAHAYDSRDQVMYCTDPTAYTIDRRFSAPAPAENRGVPSGDPASVILYRNGQLIPCDPEGQTIDWEGDTSIGSLPPNNHLVMYELPTRWSKIGKDGDRSVGHGTFRDVLALLDPDTTAPDFTEVEALQPGHAHLLELGINALELLPPADSGDKVLTDSFKWGYGTANYFAADYDLGKADHQIAPTASSDLAYLIKTCHQKGMRFFTDMVMAFARHNPYRNVNFLDFFIRWRPVGDPERDPEQGNRDGFGGDLFKYNYWVEGFHPITGKKSWFVPAREYMKVHMAHWLNHYRVDGLRLDSVNNTGSYDFLQEFKDLARELWLQQGRAANIDKGVLQSRFLVVGEELSVPMALLYQNRLDSLWNERFKQILRQVILGRGASGDSFESSVRKLIDCRLLGFRDGSEAVNYITSHDVGGHSNERFFNYLVNNGVFLTEKPIKLAFVCLLTAVGIPMILAGDEFADQHDLDISHEHGDEKQVDPVNYSRMEDDWRKRIFEYVARLVRFRTASNALAVNDTTFIHTDFNDGKRVLVWQRGSGDDIVVVVANFSDYGTPDVPNAEYVVPNFPKAPFGKSWREITQARSVPPEWVGREPIYPWEAKVYALV